MSTLSILLPLIVAQSGAATKLTELKDGFVRAETPEYILEVPKGWTVGQQTPWGARDISPAKGEGKMGAMTAPPSKTSWKQLYETSLYFIQREEKGNPTAYRIGKAKQGYETMSFEVLDAEKWAKRRYVILKKSDTILALSIRIPNKKVEESYLAAFSRMVNTAVIK